MERKEFLSTITYGLVAACGAGCLASCSKNDAPGGGGMPTPPSPPPSGVLFTVDLNNEIKNVGDSVTKSGVIIVRLAAGTAGSSFTAVQVACTHQGTSIDFNTAKGNFICPNHGSQFTTTGTVINGPATLNLKQYNISITGTTMSVSG